MKGTPTSRGKSKGKRKNEKQQLQRKAKGQKDNGYNSGSSSGESSRYYTGEKGNELKEKAKVFKGFEDVGDEKTRELAEFYWHFLTGHRYVQTTLDEILPNRVQFTEKEDLETAHWEEKEKLMLLGFRFEDEETNNLYRKCYNAEYQPGTENFFLFTSDQQLALEDLCARHHQQSRNRKNKKAETKTKKHKKRKNAKTKNQYFFRVFQNQN